MYKPKNQKSPKKKHLPKLCVINIGVNMCHHNSYQKIMVLGVKWSTGSFSVSQHTWDAKDHVSASFLRAEWSDAQDTRKMQKSDAKN